MSQVMEHVTQLAEVIGPRPPATDAEANAADYIEGVFLARGLDVERQDFDAPRTYSWAVVVYSILTLAGGIVSIWWGWPALALSVIAAVLMWLDLDTRFSISRYLGKGPTQNIIARHVPRQRRGDRLRRVVIVAHYDSAKSSLAFGPGAVKSLALLIALMKVSAVATVVVIAVGLLPFAGAWKPWTGYAACAAAAYMLLPLIVSVHREFFGRATDGANDNASGVAALFGVMEATVPESDEPQSRQRPLRRDAETAFEAGVVPADAVLEYRSVSAAGPAAVPAPTFDGFGDVEWETGAMPPVRVPTESVTAATHDTPPVTGDWVEDAGAPLWDEPEAEASASRRDTRSTPRPAPSSVPARWDGRQRIERDEDDVARGQESFAFEPTVDGGEVEPPPEGEHASHGISSWLGIGRGFDVRKAGKKIGSWDNIEDDDEFGFKAGTAGERHVDHQGLTTDVAARIRKRVTENVDRALAEKEIWFVATGSDESGMWGMRALLNTYPEELADAFIINIDHVGSGSLAFVTEEGMGRTYRADRRLVAQAKRTAREQDMVVKGRSQRGLPTGVTPALARRFKAMTVSAFDINGRTPNWHWHTDTVESVSEATIKQAVTFVTGLVRDL